MKNFLEENIELNSKHSKLVEEWEALIWDKQIEDDILAGKLDKLIEQAQKDLKAGKCKEL